jgi:CelD/BcsL family acetyltransferase involved in cellulose biosynthesis
MESRVITTYDEFLKLRVPWGELHRSATGSLFQHFDWLAMWWRVYGEARNLCVQTFWNESLLVGVLPAYTEIKWARPTRLRRMSLLGEDETYGDYSPLVEDGSVEQVAQHAASFCVNELRLGALDAVDFHGFPSESTFMKTFVGWMGEGAHVRYVRENQPHFVIEGPSTGNAYLEAMSTRRRRSLRRDQRLIREAGAEVELVTQWDGGSAFDDLIRLHTARWTRDGQPGRFGSERFTAFLCSVTELLMPEGCARIYFTRFRGERICGLLIFDMYDRNYQYLIGRDPDHKLMRHSVGEVLAMKSTIDAFDSGKRVCDLMGGDYQHKQITGVARRWYSRATAVPNGTQGARGRMFLAALAMRDALLRVNRMRVHARRAS